MALENTNNSVEIKGIEFETITPDSEPNFSSLENKVSLQQLHQLHQTPEFAERKRVLTELGISITNNTRKSFYFSDHGTIIPEMMDSEGSKVYVGGHVNGTFMPTKQNYILVEPQKGVKLFPLAALFKSEGGFEICIDSMTGMFFILYCLEENWPRSAIEKLKSGLYEFKYSYINEYPTHSNARSRQAKWIMKAEESLQTSVWKGKIQTPFREITLSQ